MCAGSSNRVCRVEIEFRGRSSSLPNDLHIPTTILRYGSIIERRIIADFPRKRMEAHELLSAARARR